MTDVSCPHVLQFRDEWLSRIPRSPELPAAATNAILVGLMFQWGRLAAQVTNGRCDRDVSDKHCWQGYGTR